MNLLEHFKNIGPHAFEASWEAPSNIAFVKYWGKKGPQIPANPSFSMSLKKCLTQTKTTISPSKEMEVDLFLNDNQEDNFSKKVKSYLDSLSVDLPWLKNLSFKIETRNTFPHGVGIASSASGMAAFTLCLTDYLYHHGAMTEGKHDFYQTAGYLARLASGSACRSVYGGFNAWGKTSSLSGSSDHYATPVEVHPELMNLKDSILVVDAKEKSVSSRNGHERMENHAYKEARFLDAHKNFEMMLSALKNADVDEMGRLLEYEALSLHSMMMSSPSPYILLRPNTILAMEMIWDFRNQTKLPLYFTLDAGPNLHLIYPAQHENKIKTFINCELSPLATEVIDDEIGEA